MSDRLLRWLGSLVSAAVLGGGNAALAADTIVLRFGDLSRSVSVPSLVTFTETGRVEPDLEGYLRLLKLADRQALRTVLNQSVPVDAVMTDVAPGPIYGVHVTISRRPSGSSWDR